MKKRISKSLVMMMVAFVIVFLTDSYVMEIIQDIFKWSTDNRIQFNGKYAEFFLNDYYHLSIGLGFFIVAFDNVKRSGKQVFINSLIALILFCTAVVVISSLDANLKVVQCTLCDDGPVAISKNAINYELIMIISMVLAIIPSMVRIVKMFIKLYQSHFN